MLRILKWCALLLLLAATPVRAADIVEGQAAIVGGDVSRAREDARSDAMRTYVEDMIGVNVESTSEVVSNMLVSDYVMTHSDGYVQVKRVVSERQAGDVYIVRLELEASDRKLRVAAMDLKGQLQAMSPETSRSGIQVAIIGVDAQRQPHDLARINQYLQAKLQQAGFRTVINDEVLLYLSDAWRSGAYKDKLRLNVELRRICRNTRTEEAALVRGELSTAKLERTDQGWRALVNASFEMIGLESNEVDTFAEYFEAFGRSADDAERKALDAATRKAADTLGALALETVQDEYRGGTKNINVTARFSGITDRAGQRQAIVAGLKDAGCRVIRSAFTSDGKFQVFLTTTRYHNQQDLMDAILAKIPGLQQGNTNENELGASKLDFFF